ncbi:pilus assembly protein [Pseudomonas sp. Leaf48]|jgi:pilus assembly protein Flp/PilA|uniref:Flp family type IVb pilin n=1 Tax=Pseudomonas sp. Leaf48 TaxID=1736221 RepID=UPI000728887F|nr:Flp family type IVb pilin [Pseudomonas sp. Leaf48]KQN53706.1 pilus assembly protein [Pseudomonas sp. Leaf48]
MSFSKLVHKTKSAVVSYKKFIKDTEGASGIEYAVVAAMVAVVLIGLSPSVKTALVTFFGTITTALTPAA